MLFGFIKKLFNKSMGENRGCPDFNNMDARKTAEYGSSFCDDVSMEDLRSYLEIEYVDARKAAQCGFPPYDAYFEIVDWGDIEEEDSCGGPVYDDAVYASEPTQELFEGRALTDLLEEESLGFSQTLLNLIDQTGKKDPEIYKKANVDKKLFSKIRNNPNYKPSKTTALAFAVALELDLDETKDLIGRAGYALTSCSKADLIVAYYIMHRVYNIHKINMTLFEFDQSLLGAQ